MGGKYNLHCGGPGENVNAGCQPLLHDCPEKKKRQDGRKRGWKQRGVHTEREERKRKHEPQAVNQLQDVCCIVVLLILAVGKGVTLQALHLDTIVNIYYHQLSLARLLCSLFLNYVIDGSGILTLALSVLTSGKQSSPAARMPTKDTCIPTHHSICVSAFLDRKV